MSNFRIKLFICIMVIFIISVGSIFSQENLGAAEFKADYSTTDSKGKTTTGVTYIKGDKIRQESVSNEETSVTILRFDKKVSWTLMPDKKYMEIAIPFDPNNPQNVEYERVVLGKETINGYDCEIVQYTYKDKSLGILTQWLSSDLNYAVKVVLKDAKGKILSTTIYNKISKEKINDSLFEIPEGYTKFSMFGGFKF